MFRPTNLRSRPLTMCVIAGFDWRSLPCGSIVVDVGGGIGSTSMLLANALGNGSSEGGEAEGLGLKFVIQDRDVVVQMGERVSITCFFLQSHAPGLYWSYRPGERSAPSY